MPALSVWTIDDQGLNLVSMGHRRMLCQYVVHRLIGVPRIGQQLLAETSRWKLNIQFGQINSGSRTEYME